MKLLVADIKGKTCPQKCDSLEKESSGSKNAKKRTRYEKIVSKGTVRFFTSLASPS
jgi:hypothetical protein